MADGLILLGYLQKVTSGNGKYNVVKGLHHQRHHHHIRFFINVQVQGQHQHQWVSFQVAGLLHAWQISHQISRYICMAIMRVDSWELPLSANPLCQLLKCHLGPPRPMLSINLYVKGCLDYTVGAFHIYVHTSGAFSPSEWGPDSQCQAIQVHVAHWTWWWHYVLWFDITDLSSLPCHSAEDVGGLALSMLWYSSSKRAWK